MIIDQLLIFDQGTYSYTTGMTGVAQHASDTTTVSTNTLDLLNARDLASAPSGPAPLWVEARVTTAYAGGTSVNFQVQGSTDTTTWTTYSESGAVPVASLGVGKCIKIAMPAVNPEDGALPRYLRVQYTFVGNVTAGNVITWLGTVDMPRYYPPGITISN